MKKKKIFILAAVGVTLVALAVVTVLLIQHTEVFSKTPTVTIETPEKKSEQNHMPFSLAVCLSDLGEAHYPAASLSISFDSSRLEFLGLTDGNIMVTDSTSPSGLRLPEWNVNIERCNETGLINIMYLDLTGGKNSFIREALSAEHTNILLSLNFRLRQSACSGDIFPITIIDACFASSDETMSLASSNGTLKVNDSRIVVGQ